MVRVVAAAVAAVAALVATIAPLGGADWVKYVPAVGAVAATLLLSISEVRHAVGRPDMILGDAFGGDQIRITAPVLPSGLHISPPPVEFRDVYAFVHHITVENRGASADVSVKITKIDPPLPDLPRTTSRPLHIAGDSSQPYREIVHLNRGDAETYDLVSRGRTTLVDHHPVAGPEDPPQSFLHTTRGPGGVEPFRFTGKVRLTVTAFAGNEHVERIYEANISHLLLAVKAVP